VIVPVLPGIHRPYDYDENILIEEVFPSESYCGRDELVGISEALNDEVDAWRFE
jgi:hypothetical protein